MLNITGYSDRIYAKPGDAIKFMVSCETPAAYHAEIVRIICGDDTPVGPGVKEIHVPTGIDGDYPGRRQNIHAGSYVKIPHGPALEKLGSFSMEAYIWPTLPGTGKQTLISKCADGSGFALVLDAQGSAAVEFGDGVAGETVPVGAAMLPRRWYRVGAGYDGNTGQVTVFQTPLGRVPGIMDGGEVTRTVKVKPSANQAPLYFARGQLGEFYNGKMDSPRLASGETTIGAWDFSKGMDGCVAFDTSNNALHGEVVNFPARAMTGWNWTGETMQFQNAPEQWGAIHFHDDDIYDAGWNVDFTLTIPQDMKSGLYAAKLTAGEDEEYIPFAVSPLPGAESKIAFLLPTVSYMAYGNDRLAMDGGGCELLNNIVNIIGKQDIFLNDHPEYGGSLYDAHSDGSGICHSSRLRPLVTMRPKRQGVLGGLGPSKLWQFTADTHVTDWLEHTGVAYDVITDEELHERGAEILAPYKVIVTGTHPEYYSTSMWAAVHNYTRAGGRLMYLGGNGFYWRVAFHPTCPGIIELRRGESGVRAWTAAPGEAMQAFDGRQGGIWAKLGRTPQALAGVGFSAQGFDISGHYVRLPDSYRPEAAFVFAGVGDEHIGDFGLIGGGAAGLELDRAAPELGTPPNALILATSANLTNSYLIVPEEFLETAPGLCADETALARADIVLFQLEGGGAVFATGSIAWAGSLSHGGYNNNVARITENVLRAFLT